MGLDDTDREFHYRRFYRIKDGKQPDDLLGGGIGSKDLDVWVDVQRIDKIKFTHYAGGQEMTYHLHWYDEDDQTKDNPLREMKKVRIVNPDDDDQFVEILSIVSMQNREFAQVFDYASGHDMTHHFRNEEESGQADSERKFEVRKVFNRQVLATADQDGFFNPGEYRFGPAPPDKTQRIMVEYPTRIAMGKGFIPPAQIYNSNPFQDYLLELTDPDEGVNEPIRLDPYQNIVNVKWRQLGHSATWIYNASSETGTYDGSAVCSPADFFPGEGQQTVGVYTKTWTLSKTNQFLGDPPFFVFGEPELSPMIQAFGAWERLSPQVQPVPVSIAENESNLEGMDIPFNDLPVISGGMVCAGEMIGDPPFGGVKGMVVQTGETEKVFSVHIGNLSGITARRRKLKFRAWKASAGAFVSSISVTVVFKLIPPR